MKVDKMPTTIILSVFSWLIAVSAASTAVYLFIFKFGRLGPMISGLLILVGGLLLAGMVRMFGVIGQTLFDLKSFLTSDFHKTLLQSVGETREILKDGFVNLNTELLCNLPQKFEQINCDLKDINQNVHRIKVFFEQIEGHLSLKK